MSAKEYRFVWRGSLEGHSTFAGIGGIDTLDLNDADHCTTVITSYPSYSWQQDLRQETTDTERLYYSYVRGPQLFNSTATNAGYGTNTNANVAMLGGHVTTSSGFEFNFYTNPGVYNVQVALGNIATTVAEQHVMLWDGQPTDVTRALTGTKGLSKWTAGMTITTDRDLGRNGPPVYGAVISPVDMTCWRTELNTGHPGATSVVAANGVTTYSLVVGTDAPFGTADTYTDNSGHVWHRLNYEDGHQLKPLAYWTPTGTISSTVGDAANNVVSVGAWGAGFVQVTISGRYGGVCHLGRLSAYPPVIRSISFQEATPTLEDVVLYDQHGIELGADVTLYCAEMVGYPICEIRSANGEADFTLTGELASYYEVITRTEDNRKWLAALLPVPDAWAGLPKTLSIRQTDADASGGTTHDTVLTVTLVSSQGKPTDQSNTYSRMPTESWLIRKKVLDVRATMWAGTGGAAADVTVTVNSTATLTAALKAAAGGVSNTTKTEIRLQEGDYTGKINGNGDPGFKDFGSGWLRIVPAPGHTPILKFLINWNVRNLEWNGIRHTCDPVARGGGTSFAFIHTGGEINFIPGRNTRVIFKDCLFGAGADPAVDLNAWLGTNYGLTQAIYSGFADQIEILDCTFKGLRQCVGLINVYCGIIDGADIQWTTNDFLQYRGPDHNSRLAGYPDNDRHYLVQNCVSRNEPDKLGWSTAAHTDFTQQIRAVGSAEWRPGDVVPAVDASIAVDTEADAPPVRVYQVMSGAGGNYGDTMPTGTVLFATETNGDAVLRYVGAVPVGTTYFAAHHNCLNADGPIRGVAGRQAHIDSNKLRGQALLFSEHDNVYCGPNGIGNEIGSGKLFQSHCTYGWPAHFTELSASTVSGYSDYTTAQSADINGDGKLVSINCLYGAMPYVRSTDIIPSTYAFVHNPTIKGTGDSAPTRVDTQPNSDPSLVMNGPFETVPVGMHARWWHFPALDDSGLNSKSAFREQLRSIMRPVNGASGIYVTDEGLDPTAFTLSISGNPYLVGEPLSVMVGLDYPATSDVTISLDVSGVTGVFGSDTIVIPTGFTSGSTTFTPSTAGTATFTADDDGILTDPADVVAEVANPPRLPASYTLGLGVSSVLAGRSLSVLLQLLDADGAPVDAVQAVTFALSSTLTGTFSDAAPVIEVGDSSVSVMFTPTVAAEGTVSVTDNRGLTDPAAAPLTVTPVGTGRGSRSKLKLRW